jgi:acyl-CoA synthetase (AMP-forming)/AMP-acid ligase II
VRACAAETDASDASGEVGALGDVGDVREQPGSGSPGDVGEVQVRGPQVASGYWRRPDATAAAFAPGGWLRTGDLGRFDEEGHLVVVDRLKDLIKFRGYSVSPGEVERALALHPAVAEVAVVGAPDPVDGEVPVAFVRLVPGAFRPPVSSVSPPSPPSHATVPPGTAETALSAHLSERLARYKHPRRYVFVAELPRNAVGKLLRRVLRAGLIAGTPSPDDFAAA